jgi:hypothetical protein
LPAVETESVTTNEEESRKAKDRNFIFVDYEYPSTECVPSSKGCQQVRLPTAL